MTHSFKIAVRRFATLLLVFILSLASCKTYNRQTRRFNAAYTQADYKAAQKVLESDKRAEKRKTKLVYYMNMGKVLYMQGKYVESNLYFEQAYYHTEDYFAKVSQEALATITNPMVTEYLGEDNEVLYVHYYKALNYLMLNQPKEALVEARRMDSKLRALEAKYAAERRFQDDAFIHLIMALVFEANQEYNDAFIAYRNSYNVYKEVYGPTFGMPIPEQLKVDLMRSAYLVGFQDELSFYEKEFGMEYIHDKSGKGNLIFLWENGLGPIKAEWSVNFVLLKGAGGVIRFQDEGNNFDIPVQASGGQVNSLGDLKTLRVAMPKYKERYPLYTQATLFYGNNAYPLQKVEDITQVSKKVLRGKLVADLSKTLLRLAVKKAAEIAAREAAQAASKDNNSNAGEIAGTVVGLTNTITERADLRNWSSLPHSIYYSRLPMEEGQQEVILQTQTVNGQTAVFPVNVNITQNKLSFVSFHTLDTVY